MSQCPSLRRPATRTLRFAASVAPALTTYINSLPLGTSLSFFRLSQVAFDTSPGVTDITAVTLNSGTADLTATAQQVIRAGTISVS